MPVFIKSAFIVLFITISIGSHADPHYVQALHPYWGHDESYLRYLDGFEGHVNVDIKKYAGVRDPDYGKNMYIYIYIVDMQGAENFSLDISCPDLPPYLISGVGRQSPQSRIAKIESVASDPVRKNPEANITEANKISWALNATAGKQAMWFYSHNPPGNRGYEINVLEGSGKNLRQTGQISGPTCKPGPELKGHMVHSKLKDPMLRDENISNTNITVDVSHEKGLYKYLYTVESPPTNLGIIGKLLIDISCNLDYDEIDIPVTTERKGHFESLSRDGKHVPAEVFAAYGTSNFYGITQGNNIKWSLFLKPSNNVTNIWVLSPAPPGQRTYTLIPYLDTNPAVWDFGSYSGDIEALPWEDDFTITGTIAAPACAKASNDR